MTRPHPLALALGGAIFVLLFWLHISPHRGEMLYSQSGITKSHTFYGWPFSFCYIDRLDTRIQIPPLLLDGIAAVIMLTPAYTLHALLRRTLHVHLASAIVLSLTASVLLLWVVREAQNSWPHNPLAVNLFIALAILSTVLLLSEHLLTRRKPLEND